MTTSRVSSSISKKSWLKIAFDGDLKMIISKHQYLSIQSGLPSTLIRHESAAKLLWAARENYHTPHVVIELLVKILLVDLLVSIKVVPSMRITITNFKCSTKQLTNFHKSKPIQCSQVGLKPNFGKH